MKVSLNWLRELVALPAGVDATQVAAALTGQGLEVEGLETRGGELAGVLVAEVLAVRPHPGAEKLRLVRVRAGAREEEVVCGAPNVPPPGNRVCWAAPGARLPGGHSIAPREIRGVLSPGMLCSEPELGLGSQGDGILILSPSAPHGADLGQHLGVADTVLEVNVTPNRPDALSHLGLARELAAHFGVPLAPPPAEEPPAGSATVEVQIGDATACPRYRAVVIQGLAVGPSPLWMRLRLEACGMRAISNLVDVTNYVLLELGHPLHAFDLGKLSGGIVARRARPGEKIVTLDGQERALVEEDVVIADHSGPVALAGVMGGASSEVGPQTRDVLLEAATFDPRSVRRTAKRLGLHSEASYRFERGVDAAGVPQASARAAALLARLGGGGRVGPPVDCYPAPVAPRKVKLTTARLRRVTGVDYDAAFAAAKLGRLGMPCDLVGDGLVATVPTWRPDVNIEEDLIEEVLRLGEYGRPADAARVLDNATSAPDPEAIADRARDLLAAAGLQEIATWAFVPRRALQALGGQLEPIAVRNPISADYEVMRTHLLPGLADALARNLARGVADVALFEVGPVVRRTAGAADEPAQLELAAGILAGRAAGWLKPGEPLDFHDLKQIVDNLLRGLGLDGCRYRQGATAVVDFLHPGVSAVVEAEEGEVVGVLGELHPRVARTLGLERRALCFEVDLAPIERRAQGGGQRRTSAPPRFPAVSRDVSFWIDAAVPAQAVRDAFSAAAEPLLRAIEVREDFRDARYVQAGKKGMLWSLTYRADDRTLTDAEADAAHARVVEALKARQGIQIR